MAQQVDEEKDKTMSGVRNERLCATLASLEKQYPGIDEGIKDVFTGGLGAVAGLLYDCLFTPDMVTNAYEAYDSDKRVSGMFDFEAFSDAILGRGEKTRQEYFHDHLDICPQCRNNPFGLCSEGAKLLEGG